MNRNAFRTRRHNRSMADFRTKEYLNRLSQIAKEQLEPLVPGSIAAIMAVEVLNHYPAVQPTSDQDRLQVAVNMARGQMSAEERRRPLALQKGVNVARAAITKAYYILKEEASRA